MQMLTLGVIVWTLSLRPLAVREDLAVPLQVVAHLALQVEAHPGVLDGVASERATQFGVEQEASDSEGHRLRFAGRHQHPGRGVGAMRVERMDLAAEAADSLDLLGNTADSRADDRSAARQRFADDV